MGNKMKLFPLPRTMFLMLFLVKAARCAGCGVDTLTPKLLRDSETGFKVSNMNVVIWRVI